MVRTASAGSPYPPEPGSGDCEGATVIAFCAGFAFAVLFVLLLLHLTRR